MQAFPEKDESSSRFLTKLLQCCTSLQKLNRKVGFVSESVKYQKHPKYSKKSKGKKSTTTTDKENSLLEIGDDHFLHDLAQQSEILGVHQALDLGKHLPPRAIGFKWTAVYSSTINGFSLKTLYRNMTPVLKDDLPVLLIIEDMQGRLFGAGLSSGIKVSDQFYGDSTTFLFRFNPQIETFKWSGNNFYFVQGKEEFFSVGLSDGKYGLWIDDCLNKGRTESCSTFGSPPLVPENDFNIRTIECWTIQNFTF